MNCAACHTNQITYQGITYQVDGAPTLADMWGMLEGLDAALSATRDDTARFERFADKVPWRFRFNSGETRTSCRVGEVSEVLEQIRCRQPHPARLGSRPAGRLRNDLQPCRLDRFEDSRQQPKTRRTGQLSVSLGHLF